MTNEQHIQFLIKQADEDFGATKALFQAGTTGSHYSGLT